MKISNYKRTDNCISYVINAVGQSKKVKHELTEYGSVRYKNLDDFLEIIYNYNEEYAECIEKFVEFQTQLLLNGFPFEWKEPELGNIRKSEGGNET